ncbi:unknown protein [Synechococcus elongatus PCC 6301]|uniref:DUF4815 domain-containing protein n=1 Tax=Synechococcus sp. (strain ATCC 27144 / PCC 6301 / SAUG 1402/1) TaxID=269084 RepID=A0A0H3K130_SYNP6|nr:DUF4815 domain-containing protein [Synechococcus elongatus]BAD78978.1 unknown protein [Synechococcus elongatus PCC 6301]
MPFTDYYNRFDPADRYDELLFRAGKGLQSAELNEAQKTFLYRLQRIADSVFKDGAVLRGTAPVITFDTGAITCPASSIYLKANVRDVAERSFTIATVGIVRVGVFLLEEEITEIEDPGLYDPAVGTRNYGEPGAARLKWTATWGYEDEPGQPGEFYPVYTIVNGGLIDQNAGPVGDPFLDLLARYDRESNGNYIVTGLEVSALGLSGGSNSFNVKQGTGNIFGYKVDKTTSTRLVYAEDPDLETVLSEPDTFTGATGGSATIQLNRFPVNEISSVTITREKTVNITHGAFTGAIDTLPDVSVLSIQSVTQGGTTYTPTTDYFLDGDRVNWSPAGAEPAPGSTYTVTYRYLGPVTPSAVDLQAGSFTVTGAVNGTLVLTNYNWKVPRIDRICMDRTGQFIRLKGIPSRFEVLPPQVPSSLLLLATVTQRWGLTPVTSNDGIRAIPFDQLERMRSLIVDLFDLVAEERLKNDISSREPSAKRGVFVDPFLDDDLRDQGITQTAAIVDGELLLPIAPVVQLVRDNNDQDWLLPYTEVIVLQQLGSTGQEKINPYASFDPLPAIASLNPAVDRWTVIDTVWESAVTREIRINRTRNEGIRLSPREIRQQGVAVGDVLSTTTRETQQIQTRTELLRSTEQSARFLRPITVQFTIEGFGPGEQLVELLFDGINLTPP